MTECACHQPSKVRAVVHRQTQVRLHLRQQRLQPAVHRRQPTSGCGPRADILHSVESPPLHLFDEEPAAPVVVAGDAAIEPWSSKVDPAEHLLIHPDLTGRIQFRVGNVSVGPQVV